MHRTARRQLADVNNAVHRNKPSPNQRTFPQNPLGSGQPTAILEESPVNRALFASAAGAAVAGALDIIYAILRGLLVGADPMRILQGVASGAIGSEAAQIGGASTAALGLGLHFGMMTIIAGFFVAWTRMIPDLNRWPWLSGPTYGLGIFVIMQFVVLPLSAIGAAHHHPHGATLLGGLLIHALGVGIPIALIAKRFASRK